MSAEKPIRANSYLLAHDYVLEMLKRLRDGVTVTPYVLETIKDDGPPISFEMRVTRIGDERVRAVRTLKHRTTGDANDRGD